MYDGMEHYCLEDAHIVNLFSFSKAYGMMGWRVGYVSASYSSFTVFLCFTPTPTCLQLDFFLLLLLLLLLITTVPVSHT
jgi:hypothetical protein